MSKSIIKTVPPDRLERLIASRAKFLAFLSARLRGKGAAEDILQSAFIKALQHGSDSRKREHGCLVLPCPAECAYRPLPAHLCPR